MCLPSDQPARDAFAALMLAAIAQIEPDTIFAYDRERFELRPQGEENTSLLLDNAYAEYLIAAPDFKERKLRDYAEGFAGRAAVQLPACYADALPNLRPLIKSMAQIQRDKWNEELHSASGGPTTFVPLGDHLAIVIGVDFPSHIASLHDDTLTQWGVEPDAAIIAATDNLRRIPFTMNIRKSGLVIVESGDCYDASRILLTDLLRTFPLRGDVIAMALHRTCLILAGSEDQPALSDMAAYTQEWEEQPLFISGIPLRLTPVGWETFVPPAGFVAEGEFRALRVRSLARDYAEQGSYLTELDARGGAEQAFAAEAMAFDSPWGHLLVATWPSMPTLLPRADRVAFTEVTPAEGVVVHGIAQWDQVIEVLKHRMTPLGIYPERYRVESFPTVSELASLDLRNTTGSPLAAPIPVGISRETLARLQQAIDSMH